MLSLPLQHTHQLMPIKTFEVVEEQPVWAPVWTAFILLCYLLPCSRTCIFCATGRNIAMYTGLESKHFRKCAAVSRLCSLPSPLASLQEAACLRVPFLFFLHILGVAISASLRRFYLCSVLVPRFTCRSLRLCMRSRMFLAN